MVVRDEDADDEDGRDAAPVPAQRTALAELGLAAGPPMSMTAWDGLSCYCTGAAQ